MISKHTKKGYALSVENFNSVVFLDLLERNQINQFEYVLATIEQFEKSIVRKGSDYVDRKVAFH